MRKACTVDRIDSWEEGITYRIAYGIAGDWQDRRSIRVMSRDATPAKVADLVAEARRRLSPSGPVDDDLIREASDDALAGRQS